MRHAAELPAAYRAGVTLLAYSGLRVSEALGLRWCDVDLVENELHVRGQLQPRRGKRDVRRVERLKSDAGARVVVLFPAVAAELVRLLELELAAGRGDADDPLLCSRRGTPLNHRNLAVRGVEAAAVSAQRLDVLLRALVRKGAARRSARTPARARLRGGRRRGLMDDRSSRRTTLRLMSVATTLSVAVLASALGGFGRLLVHDSPADRSRTGRKSSVADARCSRQLLIEGHERSQQAPRGSRARTRRRSSDEDGQTDSTSSDALLIIQASREVFPLIDASRTTLPRIHLLYGDHSPTGNAAESVVRNITTATRALNEDFDVSFAQHKFWEAAKAHGTFHS